MPIINSSKELERIIDKESVEELRRIINNTISLIEKQQIDENNYSILIDCHILFAIRLYKEQLIDESKKHFNAAITFGENNKIESKKEFYDKLNCAYSWLGAILYRQNQIKEAYSCFAKAVKHYEEVKDEANYYVKEDKIIDICKEYIDTINKKQ